MSSNNLSINKISGGIKYFDTKNFQGYPRILIIGKNSSGKSYLINHLIPIIMENYVGNISIISPKSNQNSYHGNYNSPTIMQSTIDENFLSKLIFVSKFNMDKKRDFVNLLVVDECLNTNNWKNNGEMLNILHNSQGYGMPLIISMQQKIPNWQVSFTHIFIMQDELLNILKGNSWEIYNITSPSKETIEEITSRFLIDLDNNCLVIEKSYSTHLYWYKIPENISRSSQVNPARNDNLLNINYQDETYKFSLKIDPVHRENFLEEVFDHIKMLKNNKIRQMELINENIKLKTEYEKKFSED